MSALPELRDDCARSVGDNVELLSGLRGADVFITGGTGFMGTWLAEMLAYLNDVQGYGARITLLSRNARAFGTYVPHLGTREDVTLVEGDVRDFVELPATTTHVVHAAGTPDNRVHATDPVGVAGTIATGTARVLDAAEQLTSLERLCVVSSGLVYGAQPADLQGIPEDYVGGPPFGSVAAVYPEAKRFAETLGYSHLVQDKLPVVFARPFAFIGPWQGLDKPWAINNFIRDALAGGPIRILGDGDTVRSYMYPSDMALWILRIAAAGEVGTAYNVGSDEAVRLSDLAERVARSVGSGPQVVARQGASLPVSRFVPDTSRAREALGLSAAFGLDEALARTVEWHRSWRV